MFPFWAPYEPSFVPLDSSHATETSQPILWNSPPWIPADAMYHQDFTTVFLLMRWYQGWLGTLIVSLGNCLSFLITFGPPSSSFPESFGISPSNCYFSCSSLQLPPKFPSNTPLPIVAGTSGFDWETEGPPRTTTPQNKSNNIEIKHLVHSALKISHPRKTGWSFLYRDLRYVYCHLEQADFKSSYPAKKQFGYT